MNCYYRAGFSDAVVFYCTFQKQPKAHSREQIYILPSNADRLNKFDNHNHQFNWWYAQALEGHNAGRPLKRL